MKLIANDTLHLSELRAAPLQPGEDFEVSDLIGKELVARGLAHEPQPAPVNKSFTPSKRKGK